jgi:tetratricopeptide (TPR) repeat protein
LVALGEACQIAGWTASDAGQYADAERLYLAGMRAGHAGGDRAVAANNLSCLAYQYANQGRERDAVALARSAYVGARSDVAAATATVRALLLERVAWAHAKVGEASAADRALGLVEQEWTRRDPSDDPEWVYWVNDDEIHIMAGRVWTELRRPLRAVPILERATRAYDADTGRETALYLSWLAEALVQAHEIDQAANAGLRALHLSQAAGSVRASDRINIIHRALAPHRGTAVVDEFEERYGSY